MSNFHSLCCSLFTNSWPLTLPNALVALDTCAIGNRRFVVFGGQLTTDCLNSRTQIQMEVGSAFAERTPPPHKSQVITRHRPPIDSIMIGQLGMNKVIQVWYEMLKKCYCSGICHIEAYFRIWQGSLSMCQSRRRWVTVLLLLSFGLNKKLLLHLQKY